MESKGIRGFLNVAPGIIFTGTGTSSGAPMIRCVIGGEGGVPGCKSCILARKNLPLLKTNIATAMENGPGLSRCISYWTFVSTRSSTWWLYTWPCLGGITVHGRNRANQWLSSPISLVTRVYTSQAVQDFFHQQYPAWKLTWQRKITIFR